MYPKKEIKRIIEDYKDDIIDILKITDWDISFHVLHSTKHSINKEGPCAGYTKFDYGKKQAIITLFYDQQLNFNDALCTVVHELLHIKFCIFVDCIKKSKRKMHITREEQFICSVENIIKLLLGKLCQEK